MGRQHRRQTVEVEHVLVFHPVRQPLVTVGLDQRVAARDPLAVQGNDHLALFTGVIELLGVVGAEIPHDHLAGAVLPLGDRPLESAVLQRMVFGVHRQVIDRGGLRQILRHGPRHQHTVALEPEVVMQPAGVMLLDDECIALPYSRFGSRNRLGGFCGVTHAAVLGQPVRGLHVSVQGRQQIAVAFDSLEYFVIAQLTQLGVVEFVPGARSGHGRIFPAA